jgi:trehalose 6-phosphate phosphatase
MVAVPEVLVVGNHGAEWLAPGAPEPVAVRAADDVRRRLDRALARLPEVPGAWIDHKGLSATIHYRNAPDPAAAQASLSGALADPGGGLEVRGGRMSLELRPSGLGDKGAATRAIVDRFGLRGLVVLGDDVTDLDMFTATATLRREGQLAAAIIGVGGGPEVPPDVSAAADVVLRDPDEVRAFLGDLAAAIRL